MTSAGGDGSTRRQHHRDRPLLRSLGQGNDKGAARRRFRSRNGAEGIDADIVARLREADFDANTSLWQALARGLVEYGYPILVTWGVTGQLAARVAEVGARGRGRAPQGRLAPDDAHELAAEVLVVAIETFRTRSLERWDPEGGASLRTFFIRRCLFELPDVYQRWARRQGSVRAADLVWVDDGRHGPRPDEEAEARVLTDQLLEADPELRRALELQVAGYNLAEIAQLLALSPSLVKSRKFRLRRRIAEETLDA